jgi:ubiquinone/menaquinone biosynthesis C-methylase UbiE
LNQVANCTARDRHLPAFLLDNSVRRLVSPPKKKISKFISAGFAVADIGCGPGHFTIPMAELVGAEGKVYAADSDPKSIEILKAKTDRENFQGAVEAHVASGGNLEFVPDRSVDFALANDVLCCMTDHAGAVSEIQRILKTEGIAYISVTKAFRKKDPRAVTKQEWKQILESFTVRGTGERLTNRWAIVSLKPTLPQER